MKKLFVASKNKGKIQEIEALLIPLGFEVFSLFDLDIDDIEELGETFTDNAKLKARAVRKLTGEMIIADDSGLVVEALGGRPGVHSKRFSEAASDEANNALMLKLMENESNRQAYFVCVMALFMPSGEMKVFRGELHGYIHTALEGDGGFGYDPLFIPVGHTKTLAELGQRTKNVISHRAKCLRKVLDYLEDI